MNGFVKTVFFILLAILPTLAADPGVVESKYAEKDVVLDLNAASPFWKTSSKSYMRSIRIPSPSNMVSKQKCVTAPSLEPTSIVRK